MASLILASSATKRRLCELDERALKALLEARAVNALRNDLAGKYNDYEDEDENDEEDYE